VTVAPMSAEDWPAVARIFEQGILTDNATFEPSAPSWERWSAARCPEPRLVAREGTDVIGWAALTPVSARAVYRGVGGVSIYVDLAHGRRGVGRALLAELIRASEHAGFWTLQAGIFPENTASIALHRSCGFRRVGTHERLGQMPDGRWRDVVLYERRSELIGQD
jgi:L-amino acid N-acyltransferase YncA